MSYRYKITLIGMALDTSKCPPDLVKAVFPAFDAEECSVSNDCYEVVFATKQTPVDHGPLVSIRLWGKVVSNGVESDLGWHPWASDFVSYG